MKTWQKLLLWVAVVLVTVAAEQEKKTEDDVCNFDQPGLIDRQRRRMIMDHVRPCFTKHFNEEKINELQQSLNLEGYQNFLRNFCPHVQEVTTCTAGVRNSFANCKTKNVSESFILLSELAEHLVVAGCENSGDRLAHLAHGIFLLMNPEDTLIPLRECIYTTHSFLNYPEVNEVDLTSESYLFYHDTTKLRKCMKHIEDETYKSAVQWLLDEVASSMKCKHPEEDTMVLCSELDVSKVPITSICQLEPFNKDKLWSRLDDTFGSECYETIFNVDMRYNVKYTDIEELKREYKYMCTNYRWGHECLLALSAHGELCLSQEEDKQFQVGVQAVQDYMSKFCVEDGVFLATVMQEVLRITPEHGNVFRECYTAVVEASNAREGYALLNKNMKLYYDTGVYKKCIVGKFHATSDLASSLETAFNDILKKMKCVNPEDGSVVLCETIHER